jgi:hypothetical protein
MRMQYIDVNARVCIQRADIKWRKQASARKKSKI